MGFGGSSLSYYAPPYSGPPPPLPPPPSSSTLSPLAPPFTVDRVAPRPSLPYDPFAPTWPLLPQPPPDDYPHLRPPSPSPTPGSPPPPAYEATAAADALPFFGSGGPPAGSGLASASSGETSSRRSSSLAQVEPYYPQFSAVAATSGADTSDFYGDRRLESGSGYVSGHVALSSAPFEMGPQAEGVGRSSLWTGRESVALAPDYGVAFQQDAPTAQGFVAYEDLQGGWHGKLAESPSWKDHLKYEHLDWSDTRKKTGASSDLSRPSALAPNASVGMCYSQSSDMLTFMEQSKTFDSDSSYDRYVCQTDTDRSDPRTLYSASTYFPAKLFPSSSSTGASIDKCTLKNVKSHAQHVDTYKNNTLHRGRVSIRPKKPSIDLNFQHKEGYAEVNWEGSMRKSDNAIVDSDAVKMTLPSSIESATPISHDYPLERKCELRITKRSIPGSIACEPEQSSSEMLDEILAVDSPCWKGAPSSRRSESSAFDTILATSALANKNIDDPCKSGSDYLTVENEEVALQLSGLRKGRDIVMPAMEHKDDFEPKNENEVQALNGEKNSTSANVLVTGIINHCTTAVPTQGDLSSFFSPAKGQFSVASKAVTDVPDGSVELPVISDPSSKCPTLGVDVHLLVKTIHNLSELLSSTCCLDATLLKEHDIELLRSAVSNLDVGVLRKAESGSMRPGPFLDSDQHQELSSFSEAASRGRFHATASRSNDGNIDQRNSRSAYPGKEKMHSLSEKVLNENFYGQGENPQAKFHANLWFEVEDAVSSLKYKLQVLRSTIVENCKQRLTKDAEQEASNLLKLSIQNSTNSLVGESVPLSITESPSKYPSAVVNHENASNFFEPQQMISFNIDNGVDDVDASVMARFKVLKGRIDKSNLVRTEERHGQLNVHNALSNSGIHNICGPCPSDGELDSEAKIQPAHDYDATPTGWGHQQPFHNGGIDGEVRGRSSAQHLDPNYSQGLFLNTHFSEHWAAPVGFCARGAGGLANQSRVPDSRSGKKFVAGVRDGSSDWEHVLKEELTW